MAEMEVTKEGVECACIVAAIIAAVCLILGGVGTIIWALVDYAL